MRVDMSEKEESVGSREVMSMSLLNFYSLEI